MPTQPWWRLPPKMARMVWALLYYERTYRADVTV
jgi:hypothetical protein